jgi:hypothetical protein
MEAVLDDKFEGRTGDLAAFRLFCHEICAYDIKAE